MGGMRRGRVPPQHHFRGSISPHTTPPTPPHRGPLGSRPHQAPRPHPLSSHNFFPPPQPPPLAAPPNPLPSPAAFRYPVTASSARLPRRMSHAPRRPPVRSLRIPPPPGRCPGRRPSSRRRADRLPRRPHLHRRRQAHRQRRP